MRRMGLLTPFRILSFCILMLAGISAGVAQTESSTGAVEPRQSGGQDQVSSANGIAAPVIDVWYGHRQVFRRRGVAIRWANILGKVTDPVGVFSLTYTLNGGPSVPLELGPNTRRLYGEGDFNIEMAWSGLSPLPDSNRVIITAVNNNANISRDTVIVKYQPGTTWPRPYSVGWGSAANLLDSAQVVDGKWTKDAIGIHPAEVGYDRLVAIGDSTWTDYEVTVPITIHSIDSTAYTSPASGYPAVGMLLRWAGATDDPVPGQTPKEGFNPYGIIGFYSFKDDGSGARLELLRTGPKVATEDFSGKTLQYNVAYNFKMSCVTLSNGTAFSMKVWQVGQAEPSTWDLISIESSPNMAVKGSMVLIAHHVDASFGRVNLRNVSADATPPVISNVKVIPGRTTAEITWTTDEPSTTNPDWGKFF